MIRNIFIAASLAAALLVGSPAAAWDAKADVKVTAIEVTYMPDRIVFWVDQTIGTCAAGAMLQWSPQGATQSARDQNVQAVLAGLMSAKASGSPVRAYVINEGCRVEFLHLL